MGRLTWHDGLIPPDEVWLKIGGDKGGGSFKMSFQIANILHPNSIYNTVVFCAFEASDTSSNLHIALDRYSQQIRDLKDLKWQYVYSENEQNKISTYTPYSRLFSLVESCVKNLSGP